MCGSVNGVMRRVCVGQLMGRGGGVGQLIA